MTKRRPNGAGTITLRKDGRYQGAAYVTDTNGHRVRRYAYGKTWDEAAEGLAKLQDDERKGVPVPDKSWKLGAFLDYWLEHMVKPAREPATYAKYESMVRLHIKPRMGTKLVTKLTPKQVRALLDALRRSGVGQATIVEVLKTLRNALNRARREELVGRNVAELVDMPSVETREVVPWSAAEAIEVLKVARSHRLYAAFVLVLVLGLRRGEVLGLRWSDVNLPEGQFMPRKQVQRVDGALVLKDLKSKASKAALPLPLLCAEALAERKHLQQLECAAAGESWKESGLIFTERHGGPIEPRSFSRTFDARAARSGVRRIPLHDARHTCGSLLAALKVHPRVAMAILRHSQISVTMNIYTHVASDEQRAAAALLGARLRDGIHSR